MPRIIAGTHGGRRLATPPGNGTRPTSDRVREAVFGRLEHWDALSGASVIDLYAGSGALGLEAVSRGATQVVLVEANRKAATVIRDNIASLQVGEVGVRVETAERFAQTIATLSASLVFLDPPYDVSEAELAQVLSALAGNGWLSDDALLVIERSTRSPEPTWPSGFASIEGRAYGETTVWFADRPLSSRS